MVQAALVVSLLLLAVAALLCDAGTLNNQSIQVKAFLGKVVADGDCPCIVSVQEKGKHANVGIILSPDYVITEAFNYDNYTKYNLDPSLVTVKSGSVDVATAGNLHVATRILSHPRYKYPRHDIALIKVTPPFTEQPCKLPATGYTLTDFSKAKIFAWGGFSKTFLSQLKMAEVTILPDATCAAKNLEGWCSRTQICVQDDNPKSRLRDGDFGAPLIVDDNVVAGINIYNSFDCSVDPNQVDRFVDIMPYLAWIPDNMI